MHNLNVGYCVHLIIFGDLSTEVCNLQSAIVCINIYYKIYKSLFAYIHGIKQLNIL